MKQGVEQLVSTVVEMINALGVEKALVSFDLGANGLRIRVEFRDITFRSGRMEGIAIDDGLVYIENLDLSLPPRELLAHAVVRVEHLMVRLSAVVLNRFLASEMFREKVLKNTPVEIRGLAFAFAGERVTIRGEVRKLLTFPFAIDLFPEAVNNRLRIVFENFWAAEMVPLPGWVRKTIMSVAKQKIEGAKSLRGVVAINEDFVVLNPWPKIPIKLQGEFIRFGVEGHNLLLEMGPSRSANSATASADKDRVSSKDSAANVPSVSAKPPVSQSVAKEPPHVVAEKVATPSNEKGADAPTEGEDGLVPVPAFFPGLPVAEE